MPKLNLPTVSDAILGRVELLATEYGGILNETEFATACSALGGQGKDRHASFRVTAMLGTRPAELRGRVGVHDFRDTEEYRKASAEDPKETGFHLHYEVYLRQRISAESVQVEEKGWDKALPGLAGLLGTHAVRVTLRMELRAADAAPVIKLPIALGPAEVPGFSEIQGVRLVRKDDAAPERELYSVIMQLFGDHLGVSVSAIADVQLDEDLLVRAWERTFSVAKLAVPTLEPAA